MIKNLLFIDLRLNLLLIFMLAIISLNAQEIAIVNKVTLEPIEGVLVFNLTSSFVESSDEDGKVILAGLELLDTIVFQHPSYVNEYIQVDQLMNKDYVVYLTQKVVLIEEVVISASKSAEVISEVVNQIEIVTKSEIKFRNPQTTADLLSQTGEVFVQKSQLGGGSPVIRGFEANKVLLVVDGVRLNNAIFRSGHLQNAITIDPSSLERTEVVFGPGAVIYGSDAIGGVMHFVTQDPSLAYQEDKTNVKFNGYARYSSANKEKTIGGNLNFGFNKWGSFTALSYSTFDDLRMGAKRAFSPEDWGLNDYYMDRIDGRDTILQNDNNLIQRSSGYNQWNILQKFLIEPNENFSVGLNFQASSSSNIPRYEELNNIEYSIEAPLLGELEGIKWAEWYYGPQKRLFGALNFDIENKKMFDFASTIIAYQKLEESRVKRRFGNVNKIYNIENIDVLSINSDFNKSISDKISLKYGLEVTYNHVLSEAKVEDIDTKEFIDQNEATRYPDGGSNTQSYSAYIMNKYKPNDKITLSAGIRYSHFVMNARFNDTSFINLPVKDFNFSKGALSGSVGAVFIPVEEFEIKINGSTGFRSPNVDDFGKVREKDGEVTVPNLDLKPEYAFNGEVGIIKSFDKVARISLNGYYTHLSNAIVRSHTQINGMDSILYEGESTYIITNKNVAKARVYGFSIGFDSDIGKYVSLLAQINYTKGRELPSNEPLAHIPPIFGKVSFLTKLKRFQAEVYVHFNAQKSTDEYSNSSEDRLSEATDGDGGTPGWFTFNIRTTAQLHKNLTLQAGIENVFDQHYKPFSSGISAAGRNFIVTLRGKF